MVKSMTAFSRAETTQSGLTAIIEIHSYNSRHLDIVLHLPNELHILEDKIRKHISACLARGHISVRIDVKETGSDAMRFDVDTRKANAYYHALSQLKTELNIRGEISLDLLLLNGNVITPVEIERDMETYWQVIEPCLNIALEDLDKMRSREGDFLYKELCSRLEYLEKGIEQIEKVSGNLVALYRDRLKDRISLLVQGTVALDPDRIAQEAAILADKSDITEEIVRIKSHIDQFGQIMNDAQPAGRRLNFLLQEFNREFNTIGSKTANAGVSYTVVDAKSEIEKIREQIQNVE